MAVCLKGCQTQLLLAAENHQRVDAYVQSSSHIDYKRLGLSPNRLGRRAFRTKRRRPRA